MHANAQPSGGRLPVDRAWFIDVNQLARDARRRPDPAYAFAKYGVVLFAVVTLIGYVLVRRPMALMLDRFARTPLRVLAVPVPAGARPRSTTASPVPADRGAR